MSRDQVCEFILSDNVCIDHKTLHAKGFRVRDWLLKIEGCLKLRRCAVEGRMGLTDFQIRTCFKASWTSMDRVSNRLLKKSKGCIDCPVYLLRLQRSWTLLVDSRVRNCTILLKL